ncbi:hypothetical protein NC653_030271 [Populus alba x Populus x berolinensis]|uniref:Agenet domain-containing protein n=1 Tax=Populus alba x Populus x berolinensis TaxID=444605 RepID=A0AAD6LVY2_9ROSI|nr:hypothetical protein NC653_030271 [Populus alba x Populus x berolinensis]
MLEEVDALYNDVWWVGVVCEVNTFPQYVVSFKDTGRKLEFKHSDLRPHQDWINGKWVAPSHVFCLPWPRTGLGSFYMFTAVKVNAAE